MRIRTKVSQSGAALLVSLIMLILITMLVITSFNLGNNSLQTVGNMQHRSEATHAAQEALEKAISSTRFFDTPSSTFDTACEGSYNKQCIDVNGDGASDVTVELTPAPTCVQARVLLNHELDVTDDEEAGCIMPASQEMFGLGGPTDNSECATSIWELQAVATDQVTEANVTLTQGVSVSVPKNSVDTSCPS